MITTHICYTAACDVCGEEPEGPYGDGVDHSDDARGAIEDARDADWWATDAIVLCDKRDPKHMAVAHDIAKDLNERSLTAELGAFLELLPQIWRDEIEIEQPKTFAAVMPGQTAIPIGA